MKKCRKNVVSLNNQKRIMLIFMLMMVALIFMVFRLAWIQVINADEYKDMAIRQQKGDIPIEAKRGNIYDRNGKVLAASAVSYNLWVRPKILSKNMSPGKVNDTAIKLANIINRSEKDILKNFNSKNSVVKVATYLEKSQLEKVQELDIPGLEVNETSKRHYPMGTFAAQLLGSVNDENVGRTGMELEYDQYLSGVAGRWIRSGDVFGDPLAYGSEKYYGAENGLNVELTIDEILQHYLEEAMAAGMKKTKAKQIMGVAMNPKTGDILAMATLPNFDPNDPMRPKSKKSRKEFNELNSDEQGKYLNKMWRNPVTSDVYEPGSTFKLITTSAALEEGVTQPTDRFNCPGYRIIDGVKIKCWKTAGHGDQDLKTAMLNSCNPVQMDLVDRLGADKFYKYLQLYGITESTGIDYPGETHAIIPSKNNLNNVVRHSMSFGQSIAVTPLQLITAISAIGNEGMLLKPRLVKELTDDQGKSVKKFPTVPLRKVISTQTAEEVKDMMTNDVENGSGGPTNMPGYKVGGKTGTSEKAIDGVYSNETIASFIAMAPMENPKITVLVVVDEPKGENSGAWTAAPIIRDFFDKAFPYLGIQPKFSEEEKKRVNSDLIDVPDITGKTIDEGEKALAKAGLKYNITPDPNADKNKKISDQYPKPGVKIRNIEKVYIYTE